MWLWPLWCGEPGGERRVDWASVVALGCVAAVVIVGAVTIPAPPAKTFGIAATVDLANQDPDIKKYVSAPK